MITQKIKVNLVPDGIAPELWCSKGDSDSRTVELTVLAGYELFDIPAGATVTFQGTAANGTTFQQACTYSGNVVTTEISSDMTGEAGKAVAELAIQSGDELIHSENIILKVEGL